MTLIHGTSVLLLLIAVYPAAAQTYRRSTLPTTADRSTPAAAMNTFVKALESGDIDTAIASINGHVSRDRIESAGSEVRFTKAVEARFGRDVTVKVCDECGLSSPLALTTFTDDQWDIAAERPDQALAKSGEKGRGCDFMQRGPDGNWRIGRIFPARGPSTRPSHFLAATSRNFVPQNELSSRLDPVTIEITNGKYSTPEDVIRAVYPEGTPKSKMRQDEERQKHEQQIAGQKYIDEILNTHFDPSTLSGAIGAFTQAMYKKDAVGMAKFYLVKDAPDDHFALETAKGVLAVNELEESVRNCINPIGSFSMLARFSDAELIVMSPFIQPVVHGDSAIFTQGDPQTPGVWFHKVRGIWKQDISPPDGRSLADRTEDLEEDIAAVTRITGDIRQGKLKTADQVRDALRNALLNCFRDSTFTMEMQSFEKPKPRDTRLPQTNGVRSEDPQTPSGAMNHFIRAVENDDPATVADSLFVLNDKDALAASSMAHDYIVGVKYVRAVQKEFPQFETKGYRFSDFVIGPESLRDYTDDEWWISNTIPNLALSANKNMAVPDAFNGGKSFTWIHEWTPILHRCPDGHWRLGPWYPQNPRQLSALSKTLKAKDEALSKTTLEIQSGKIDSTDGMLTALDTELKPLALDPIRTTYP